MKRQSDGSKLSDITTYQVGVVQSSVHRLLQRRCDELLEPYGITKNHWLVIGLVLDAGQGGIRISELAKQIDTNLPYLTNTINLLETKKILTRKVDNKDSRSKYVSVERKYVSTAQKIEQVLRQGLRESIYSGVSIEDFKVYMKVLYQLQAIDEKTRYTED